MLHPKLIDATIGVRNPINFCADKYKHSLIHLKNTYEGKCFKGSFIVSVDSIPKISDCRIVSNTHSAEGCIDVQFAATVAVFSRWDIIPRVKIVRSEQLIVGSTAGHDKDMTFGDPRDARVVVTLMPSPEAKTVRVGQMVTVRVASAEHAPMQQHASAAGTLLTCERSCPVYRIRGALEPAAAAELLPIVSAIDRELKEREVLYDARRTDMMFFEILLYSYSRGRDGLHAESDDWRVMSELGSPEWVGPPEAKIGIGASKTKGVVGSQPYASINMLDLVKKVAAGESLAMDDLWSRPLTLYRSSPLVARAPRKSAPAGWGAPIDTTPSIALQVFLKGQLEFLFAVRAMAETYNTKELVDEHVNLWIAMHKAQLSQQTSASASSKVQP